MIATVALAVHLLAKADFSHSGRRKMAGGVLDGGRRRSTRRRLARKSGLFTLRARISGAKSAALFDPLRAK